MTYEEVDALFVYDPETGLLTNKVRRGARALEGSSVGCYHNGYLRTKVKRKPVLVHRLAWLLHYGELPADGIDHINGKGDDNRIVNLRDVTVAVNNRNAKMRTNNISGIVGVHARGGSWCARIGAGLNRVELGSTQDFFEACCLRKSAELRYGYTGRVV